MSEDNGAPTLFTQDDTGNYVEYTPPEAPGFHDTLPEDIRASEHLAEVKDTGELARYYVDLKSNYLKPPESAEGYEFEKPDNFHLDEPMFNRFRQLAFENNVNQKQFDAIMKLEVQRYNDGVKSINESIESNRNENEKALKTEWGDKYDQNLESAKRVLNHERFADNGFKEFLENTRFGDNAQVVKFFYKLSQMISEDAFQKPGTGESVGDGISRGDDGRPRLRFPSMEKK